MSNYRCVLLQITNFLYKNVYYKFLLKKLLLQIFITNFYCKFITDVFCQFDMITKFMTKDIEENEVSTQLKSELTHFANCYIYKYTPSKSSLKKHKILQIQIKVIVLLF